MPSLAGVYLMKPIRAAIGSRARLLVLLCWLLPAKDAMATETPTYRVTQSFGEVEIREYSAQIVAETEVEGSLEDAGNQAFRRLAGYIFGKNKGSKKIAMTAPVTQSPGTKIAMTAPVTQVPAGTGKFVVRFMMPAEYSRDTLPEPIDPSVHIAEQPGRLLAVLRYSGTWSRRNYEQHVAELRTKLAAAGLTAHGEPTWARYDPPWTPWFMRRNEIMIEIEKPVRVP